MAATFALGRADMNVVWLINISIDLEPSSVCQRATSKGLFAGEDLIIHLKDGGEIRGHNSEVLMKPSSTIARFEVKGHIAWVLVVEKEAVFQTLCRYKFASHASLPGRGIIITGKGYPDVATRQLVKTLSDNLSTSVPLLVLVDGDAYGIDILSVYKFGSASMRHESERMAAKRVRWLGIKSSELLEFGIDRDAMIPITGHDEKKALSLLQRPENVMPKKWRRELMHMLHLRRKAEIEILTTVQPVVKTSMSPLVAYLCGKITNFVERYREA
ncbi:DNA topoisomerase IV, alpha subunit [Neolentinus lepideus HHB14362 ss-1]|uniref:DNA topoisomerase IV, alpha subunit n=1 Tax=Neolentinus lepideus HHB14362 ss-1 TaxID=1314782 RepID=A0A165NP06_9AGAM|nr:DNA topoisomerase IV, alpha subunit [Neolentinus lepideus HHB14362 ss-1]